MSVREDDRRAATYCRWHNQVGGSIVDMLNKHVDEHDERMIEEDV